MEPMRWICFLLLTVLTQNTQGHLFVYRQKHQESLEYDEKFIPDDPYRSPLKPEYFCAGPCKDGWTHYMRKCHMYILEADTWKGAATYCKNLYEKAHVTSIMNEEHGVFLKTLAKVVDKSDSTRSGSDSDRTFWTGASDTQGSMKNTLENMKGFLWAKTCHTLKVIGLVNLDITNCNTRLPFICMYKPQLFPV
ncbi:dromaiocalcin-2-like [Lissotriton helveticus]